MKTQQVTRRNCKGEAVPLDCEWCGHPATGRLGKWSAGGTKIEGSGAAHCADCKGKARRFAASLTKDPDKSWLANGKPDLVFNASDQSAITIKDGRALNQNALRGLLPTPPRTARKRKVSATETPEQKVDAIARRRKAREREAERDNQALRELVGAKIVRVAYVADKLKVSRQAVYQLAS